jgi:serine acetyltransferase
VFLGVDTMVVAPVTLGDGSKTGAGAVVTKDVPPGKLAVGVPARIREPRAATPPELETLPAAADADPPLPAGAEDGTA